MSSDPYAGLSPEDFDAIVTGESTHMSLWLEGEINQIILNYFKPPKAKREAFERLILRRDHMTFQDKINLVEAMAPLFSALEAKAAIKSTLDEVVDFKRFRNALAHGVQGQRGEGLNFTVSLINRAGKEVEFQVSPKAHVARMAAADRLLKRLTELRERLANA